MIPIGVVLADMFDDQQWFYDHPYRQYRIRPGWVVRHTGGIFLRTPLSTPPTADDSERSAERIWWETAWPDMPPLARAKAAKKTRGKKPSP